MDSLSDWFITFGMVVTKPLPQTYLKEAARAKGKFPSAILWLAFYAMALNLSIVLQPSHFFSVPAFLISLLIIPVAVLLFVYFVQLLYRRLFLGKQDYYDELLYLAVANLVPFVILDFLLAPFPKPNEALSWISLAYPLVLTIIAIKGLAKLRYWQSAVVVILAAVLASAGCICAVFTIFGLIRAVPGVV